MSGAQYFILSPWKSIEKYFVSGLVYNASLQKNDCILYKIKVNKCNNTADIYIYAYAEQNVERKIPNTISNAS